MSDNQDILEIGQNAEGNGPTKFSAEVTASGDNKVNTIMDFEDVDIAPAKLAVKDSIGLIDDLNTDSKNELYNDISSPKPSSSTPGSSVADFDASDITQATDGSVKNGPADADSTNAPNSDFQQVNEDLVHGVAVSEDGIEAVEQTEETLEEDDDFEADIIDTAAGESSSKPESVDDGVDEVLEQSSEPSAEESVVEKETADDENEEVNELENDIVEDVNELENDTPGNLNETDIVDNSQEFSEDDIVETEDNSDNADSNQVGDAVLDLSDDDIIKSTEPDGMNESEKNDNRNNIDTDVLSSAVEEALLESETAVSKDEDENVDENKLSSLDEDSKISEEAEHLSENRESEQITDESEEVGAAEIDDSKDFTDKIGPIDDDIEKYDEVEDSNSNVDDETVDDKQTTETTGADDQGVTEDVESPADVTSIGSGVDEITEANVGDDDKDMETGLGDEDIMESGVGDDDIMEIDVGDDDIIETGVGDNDKDVKETSLGDEDIMETGVGDEDIMETGVGDDDKDVSETDVSDNDKDVTETGVGDEDIVETGVGDNDKDVSETGVGDNDKDVTETSVADDDKDVTEISERDIEEPEAMETDSADVQTERTENEVDKQADDDQQNDYNKTEADNEDIDHQKSPEAEAEEECKKSAENSEGEDEKKGENMEVGEGKTDVMEVDSKSDGVKKVTESITKKGVAKDDTANKTSKTGDTNLISEVDVKKEVTEETDQKKEDSKESEPEDTDNSMGLKIVGVTSAVGIEDKVQTESKPKDSDNISSFLDIKISSVSGSCENDKKKEEKDKDKKASMQPKSVVPPKIVGEVKKKATAEKRESRAEKAKAEDDDVIAIKEEKKPVPKPKPSKIQKCIVCKKIGKCKYNIVRNGDVKHLCDDECFKRFRSNPTVYLKQAETSSSQDKPAKNNSNSSVPATEKAIKSLQVNVANQKAASNQAQIYKTCNVCQLMNVRTSKPFLNWQGLDFCGEECLGKFQSGLSLTCSYCSSHIQQGNKAKHCWRVGSDVKHFCSPTCINDFVKRMKLCAFCNKDLVNLADSFMAPVGEKGTFKDFCSQKCLQQFEEKNNQDVEILGMENGKSSQPPKGNFLCAVCGKLGPVKHELTLDGKSNKLCCDACFSAFQYAKKLSLNPCFSCGTSCVSDNQSSSQFIQFEGQQKRFCSFMCVNTFRNKYKKTVTCTWCGAKKNNFDMIERVDANSKYQLFCSLNCLSLYRVNLQATSNQAVVCDQCRKYVPAQYHLTMSDASVRNFCSYGCVMQFQAQFQIPNKQSQQAQPTNQTPKQAFNTTPAAQPVTTTRSGRVVKSGITAKQLLDAGKKNTNNSNKANAPDSFPIISNVVSLAPKGNQQQINIKSSTPLTVTQQGNKTTTSTTTTGNQTVQQQIIIQPPPPKAMKNKSLLCKPYCQTKATSCRPHTQTKETQTDGKIEPEKYLVPVPVPIYCPTPLAMYNLPTPIMVPVPVAIPVPVFIPTTKKSASSILKQIKEIQEKIPADPLEAELLMMAEAVAGKEEESSSDSEDGETEVTPVKEPANPPQGELGEDMLQMALRMASEMSDEPVMDLETSLEPVAVSTLPPPAPPTAEERQSQMDEDEEFVPAGQRQTRRSRGGGTKRASRSTPRRNAKRQKVEPQPELQDTAPSSPAPVAPPLDANFHLKYTYGVNAFKHWVMQKNTAIEQQGKSSSGKTPKTFKIDILQCTPDELNYSLCLFVKEVRKPNGELYAVDSIYYLTLGIQQYLFENGRIDNIFTDFYYEKFTDCLNDLLTRYEPKLNHAAILKFLLPNINGISPQCVIWGLLELVMYSRSHKRRSLECDLREYTTNITSTRPPIPHCGQLVCRIEEEHLWESKQLGAHSPYVLLNSLVYFNTKYFMLKTSEDHLKLSFTHIMKHWKKNPLGRGSGTGANQGRSVYLRYYCPTPQNKTDTGQKKKKEEMPVYEQTENLDNPLRCPVKLYEFYLSKCPESIKNRNDTFYLVPERSCVPDSPVWYSTAMLGIDQMAKMLNRIRLVREIQEAHLHTQPIFI